jgi:glutamine synthetase
MTEAERSKIEVAQIPTSLGESLLALVGDHTFTDWLGRDFADTYVAIKQRELASLYGATAETICKKYVSFY